MASSRHSKGEGPISHRRPADRAAHQKSDVPASHDAPSHPLNMPSSSPTHTDCYPVASSTHPSTSTERDPSFAPAVMIQRLDQALQTLRTTSSEDTPSSYTTSCHRPDDVIVILSQHPSAITNLHPSDDVINISDLDNGNGDEPPTTPPLLHVTHSLFPSCTHLHSHLPHPSL